MSRWQARPGHHQQGLRDDDRRHDRRDLYRHHWRYGCHRHNHVRCDPRPTGRAWSRAEAARRRAAYSLRRGEVADDQDLCYLVLHYAAQFNHKGASRRFEARLDPLDRRLQQMEELYLQKESTEQLHQQVIVDPCTEDIAQAATVEECSRDEGEAVEQQTIDVEDEVFDEMGTEDAEEDKGSEGKYFEGQGGITECITQKDPEAVDEGILLDVVQREEKETHKNQLETYDAEQLKPFEVQTVAEEALCPSSRAPHCPGPALQGQAAAGAHGGLVQGVDERVPGGLRGDHQVSGRWAKVLEPDAKCALERMSSPERLEMLDRIGRRAGIILNLPPDAQGTYILRLSHKERVEVLQVQILLDTFRQHVAASQL